MKGSDNFKRGCLGGKKLVATTRRTRDVVNKEGHAWQRKFLQDAEENRKNCSTESDVKA